MKRVFIATLLFLALSFNLWSADFIGVGDSIAHGAVYSGSGGYPEGWIFNDGIWPYLVTKMGGSKTFVNHGVDGQTANYVDTNINTWLAADTPSQCFMEVGTNDACAWSVTWSSYSASLDSILAKVRAATPTCELIVLQLLPRSDCKATITTWVNSQRTWCQTNSVRLIEIYDALEDPANPDELNPTYSADNVPRIHPNQLGYELIASLIYSALAPHMTNSSLHGGAGIR
jgi:lysophospholipase L1-like esterase